MKKSKKILYRLLITVLFIITIAASIYAALGIGYIADNYPEKSPEMKSSIISVAIAAGLYLLNTILILILRKRRLKVIYTRPGAKALKELKLLHSFTPDNRIVFSLEGTYHKATYRWRILQPGKAEWEQLTDSSSATYTTDKTADQLKGTAYTCFVAKRGKVIAYAPAVYVDNIFSGGGDYHYSYTGNRSSSNSKSNNSSSNRSSNTNNNRNSGNFSDSNRNNNKQTTSNSKNEEFNFFLNCETKEQIIARYRQLIKAFHPDTGNGDEKTAATINLQYEELMKRYNRVGG